LVRGVAFASLVAGVASGGCNAIGGLGDYQIQEPDVSSCGVAREDCATSLLVTGGTFSRNYDGVTDGHKDPQYKATISSFKLDKYDVTVGRFRVFLNDVVQGWTPAVGSGKHTHLNGGEGLRAANSLSPFEPGWEKGEPVLRRSKADWDVQLTIEKCPHHTWTRSPGANEKLPINCVTWSEAAAFCIWDHGFLPSEAELNYAASGGSEHRKYPWGAQDPANNADLEAYDCWFHGDGPKTCEPNGVKNIAPVGSMPAGQGKYGQMDLAGNLFEWVLDRADPYVETQCTDCSYVFSTTSSHVVRGGSFQEVAASSNSANRTTRAHDTRYDDVTMRCARSP
jgi:formylglycine-generating enzyme